MRTVKLVDSHSSEMVTHLYWSSYSDKIQNYVNYAGPESSDPGHYAGDMEGQEVAARSPYLGTLFASKAAVQAQSGEGERVELS